MTQSEIKCKDFGTGGLGKFNTLNLPSYIQRGSKMKHKNNKLNTTKSSKDLSSSIMIIKKISKNSCNRNNKSISIDKDSTTSMYDSNNNSKKKDSYTKNKHSKIINLKARVVKDPVIAFFNRNFYCCEIPVPKKITDNQKILDYYLKDKKEKKNYLQKYNKYMALNKNRSKSYNLNQNSYKKSDIKDSLMLDNFKIYNRIHQVVRFWSKLINYACPIFQVQKINLSSLKYKKQKKDDNSINYEEPCNKSSSQEKISKLPRLYTNSSKVFLSGLKKDKFLRKNNSLGFNMNMNNNYTNKIVKY